MKVFVYGTLKEGFGNHDVMKRAQGEFIRTDSVQGFTLLSLGGFPGMVHKRGGTVKGEVYTIPDDKLEVLDWLEGFPTLYVRAPVELDSGERATAYLLTHIHDNYKDIGEEWCVDYSA